MYHLSVVNHTEDILAVTLGAETDITLINPSCHGELTFAKWKSLATLKFGYKSLYQKSHEHLITLNVIKHAPQPTRGWDFIQDDTHPCTIYRLSVTRKVHRLIIFPRRSLSSFLADMPSTLPLSSLMFAGTHHSAAFYGWPFSQCQDLSTPLAVQLLLGIRVLDVRLSVIDGVLISYHGIYPQRLPFLNIVQTVHTFLTSREGSGETIVMSVKQEERASPLFSRLVHSAVYDGPGGRDMWFLENRVPTLGEVRGKVVLFSRFARYDSDWEGGLEGVGIHPPIWPDSRQEGFEWWLKGTLVKTHDWYGIPSFLALPEKAQLASRNLLQQSDPPPPFPVLSISFLSAVSIPLAPPPLVACGFGWPSWGLGVEGVNSRVGRWILDLLSGPEILQQDNTKQDGSNHLGLTGARLRGWCMMDYFKEPVDVGLVRLLVECNYRSRKAGEEGWPSGFYPP